MVFLLLLLFVCLLVCLFSRNMPPVYFTSFIYTWLFENRVGKDKDSFYNLAIKDVRAHCYCASLVRTLYMTWRLPLHVFQARAPSRNSTKYRADELCGNLISEYFCWMPGDPHFFFGRSRPLLILSIILKNKKKNLCVGSFNYFSYTIQIRSNQYMATGVCDVEVTFFKVYSTIN